MSKTVDERIVQMQFDNKQFEKNVQTSMSTLDKLKQSLNFTSASKSFDNLSASAKNVDMSGLSGAVETVKSKFSALEIVGVTALVNITNSAVNAGKRMISSLTIEPISDGFSEYEMTLNAIQTTMSATSKTAEEVEKELKKLDEYADKTVYSTSDMLSNLPKFTNAGVELEQATKAMIGIANATAHAGGGASQASSAFYNLGQAIGTGYLTRMDYNSISNTAGITTMRWKEAMVEAAIAQGTLTKVGEDSYKAGKKTFSLQQLFIDGLQEQWATTDVMMKVLGDYGDETTEIGKEAYASAQNVKTFSMMMDSLKASAGTGWKDTWQILIGDLDDATELWTSLTNVIGGVLDSFNKARNNLLEGALGNPFAKMFESISSKLDKIKSVTESVTKLTDSLEYYQDVVNKVWRGDYKNADTGRYGLLDADGYDHRVVQDLVNKGLDYKLTVEDIAESQKKFGITVADTADAANTMSVTLENLSDEQLKNAGLTAEEIALYRQLAEESKRTGKSIEELLAEMSKKDGRTLLIESFQNAGQGLVAVLKAVKDAWVEIFPPMTSIQLYNIIAGLNSFSENLRVSDEKADKLKRTLKGVFAIIDIIATITGGAFRIAFKVLTAVLGAFNLDILDVTAYIGDAIVKFRDWIKAGLDMTGVIKKIVPHIVNAAKAFVGWIKALAGSDSIAGDIIRGLVNGLTSGLKNVGSAALNLAKKILETVKNFLGIESPSKRFIEIGEFIIQGLVNGVKSGFSAVVSVFKTLGSKCIEIIKGIDLGNVFAAVVTTGIVLATNKIGNFLGSFGSMFEGLGDMFTDVGKGLKSMFKGIGKSFKASALEKQSKALLNFAIAIGILAGIVVILAKIGTDGMWGAVSVVAALAAIMIGLTFALSKLSTNLADAAEMGIVGATLMTIAGSLLSLAIVMRLIGGMSDASWSKGMASILAFTGIIAALVLVTKLATKKDMLAISTVLSSMTKAMILFVIVMKLVGGMSEDKFGQGLTAILAFTAIIAALIFATKLMTAKDMNALGSVLKSMSVTMLLFAVVMKLVGGMSEESLGKGLTAILAFTAIISLLIFSTKLVSKKDMTALGATLTSMAGAMIILAVVMKILSTINPGSIVTGILAITALGIVMAILTKSVGKTKDAGKIAGSLLAMSVAIGILAGIAVLLGFVSIDHLAKGIIAVGLLGGIMTAMIWATKGADNCKGNIIAMTVAIGVLAVAIAALSFIDPVSLAASAGALSAVMAAFALLIKTSGSMKKGTKGLLTMAVAMGLVMAEIAIALAIMSKCNAEGSVNTAIAISTLLLAMSGAMTILSEISSVSASAIGSMALLGLVVAELGVILGILSLFNIGPEVLAVAPAISVLLIGMSGALGILSLIGPAASGSYPAMLALAALIAGFAVLVGALGAIMCIPGVETAVDKGIDLLVKLATGLGELVGGVISGLGVGITRGLPEMGENIAAFAENLSSVDGKALDGAKNAAGVLLALSGAALIEGLSQIFGGESISEFSEQLIPFAENIVKFSDKLTEGGGINAEAVEAASNAGKMIASFASDIPTSGGVLGFIMGENDMDDFAEQMVPFAEAIVDFSDTVAGKIDSEAVEAASNAGSMIASFASDIPNSGGVLGFIMGDNDMDDFAAQMVPFAEAIVEFSDITKDKVDTSAVETAVNAGSMIAALGKDIPTSGGVVGFIMGDNDMDDFGAKLPAFARGLNAFSYIISNGGLDTDSVEAAVNAGSMLAALGNEIPTTGGVVGFIMGDKDMSEFGEQLKSFAQGIVGFSNIVSANGGIDEAAITAAATAGSVLTNLANSIPESDGAWDNFVEFFTGSDDIDGFMDQFAAFGSGIVAFSDEVKDIDNIAVQSGARAGEVILGFAQLVGANESVLKFFSSGQGSSSNLSSFGTQVASFGVSLKDFSSTVKGNIDQTAVDNAVTAASSIVGLVESLPDVAGKMDLGILGEKVVSLGNNVLAFSTSIPSDVQTNVTGACDSIGEIINIAKTTSEIDEVAFAAFVTTLGDLGNNSVNKFAEAFDNSHETVKTAVRDMLDALKKAVGLRAISVIKSFTDIVAGVKTAIAGDGTASNTGKYQDFYDAGAYLVDGFVAGINANMYKASAKAAAMASAAVEAAKEELDEHSPSRVFYGVGKNAGAGFVNALTDYSPISYKAGSAMADSARKGLTWAISKIADVVENDIDTQPTIRPVLDLSSIRAGASSIGGMLAVDATAVGRISASMSGIQNRNNNGEIVSAINKLRRDIADNPRTVNNINGVTYDDGSNIVSAVETIVRYATIEGRS